MSMIKITLKIDEATWNELKLVAKESHQNISGLLTEAVNDYLKRRRIRPEVSQHLADSIQENKELGKYLAR
jgi:predicted transcriptional regulator